MKPAAPEYLPPSERAALLALPAWTDADLAAVLGVSRDTLRRAIQPDATAARPGALDLRLARVIHLGATRLWDAEDVRRLVVAAGRRAASLSPAVDGSAPRRAINYLSAIGAG